LPWEGGRDHEGEGRKKGGREGWMAVLVLVLVLLLSFPRPSLPSSSPSSLPPSSFIPFKVLLLPCIIGLRREEEDEDDEEEGGEGGGEEGREEGGANVGMKGRAPAESSPLLWARR